MNRRAAIRELDPGAGEQIPVGMIAGEQEDGIGGQFGLLGAVAGVDTGTIFIENGRFHGEKIVETIAARL